MRRLLTILCFLAVNPLVAQFKNVKLAEGGADASSVLEPAISVSTKNYKNIVATVSTDRIFYTIDEGEVWNETKITSQFGLGGDQALLSDIKGHFHLFHSNDAVEKGAPNLSALDRIVCQSSDDGGITWSKGGSIGYTPAKNQKWAWATVHPKRQILYATWTQFDKYAMEDPNCQTNILFSMSTNGGDKWDKPVQVSQNPGDCTCNDNTVAGSGPVVGIDGRIFAIWANQQTLFFDRSYDAGRTWLSIDLPIAKQVGGWSMAIPGFGQVTGRPVMVLDNGANRTHGSLYVVFADQKNGANDTDVWLIRSTNRGDNWTAPMRINQDGPGKHQFSPWITIDQASGFVYIVYFDRRAYDDLQTDVYLAYSMDGGNTFKEKKISETPFTPSDSKALSRYCDVSAHAGVIAPIWTRIDGTKSSVWTTIIHEESLVKK